MDEVFTRLCFPILLTYDSATVAAHSRTDATYEEAINAEFAKHYTHFTRASISREIKIVLILLPMNTKAKMLECFMHAQRHDDMNSLERDTVRTLGTISNTWTGILHSSVNCAFAG